MDVDQDFTLTLSYGDDATSIQVHLTTGVPEITARLRTSAAPSDPTKTLYGTVYTVTDSISRTDESAFVWTICPRIEHRVRAHLSSGVPELTARLRTHLPQSVQIQAYLRTGVPEVTARVRLASGRVRVNLTTGVPEVTAHLRVDTPDPARIQVHLASGVPELTALLRTLAATPHCQMFMFTLDEVEAFGGEVQWAFTNVRIDSELVVGGVDAYLGVMLLSSSVVFNVAAVRDDLGGGSGPQMIEPWTRNREAIRLTNGSNTVTIPGPNSPLASSVDPSEPYRWTLEPEAAVPYDAFRAAFDENLPTAVRLCDYSLPDARIRALLSTGVPEVTARVRTTTLVASRIPCAPGDRGAGGHGALTGGDAWRNPHQSALGYRDSSGKPAAAGGDAGRYADACAPGRWRTARDSALAGGLA